MNEQRLEEIKDSMVDFIYEFLKLDKQTIVKTGYGDTLHYIGSAKIDRNDPILQNTKYTVTHAVPEKEYMTLIFTHHGLYAQTSFTNRLHARKLTYKNVEELCGILDHLKASGYVVSNRPNTDEIKLTPKGINHYEKGLSFKKDYITQRIARQSNIRSKWSLTISIVGIVIAIITAAAKYWGAK